MYLASTRTRTKERMGYRFVRAAILGIQYLLCLCQHLFRTLALLFLHDPEIRSLLRAR